MAMHSWRLEGELEQQGARSCANPTQLHARKAQNGSPSMQLRVGSTQLSQSCTQLRARGQQGASTSHTIVPDLHYCVDTDKKP